MKIAVFTKNWLGDAIFTDPLIRGLRKKYSQASLFCVTSPRCASIFESHPDVDRVILFDEKTSHRNLIKRILFSRFLKQEKIDLAYFLHRSSSRVFLSKMAGIKERIGLQYPKKTKYLTRDMAYDGNRHDAETFLSLLDPQGDILSGEERKYRFYFDELATEKIQKKLKEKGLIEKSFLVLNPGANWKPKRWPIEFFQELARKIIQNTNSSILITGAPHDKVLAEELIKVSPERIFSFAGETSLKELGALMNYAQLVITSDSGPMHIASGVGAKVIALFGPTNFVRTGPYGVGESKILSFHPKECDSPCFNEACQCMREIPVEEVFSTVQEWLDEKEI